MWREEMVTHAVAGYHYHLCDRCVLLCVGECGEMEVNYKLGDIIDDMADFAELLDRMILAGDPAYVVVSQRLAKSMVEIHQSWVTDRPWLLSPDYPSAAASKKVDEWVASSETPDSLAYCIGRIMFVSSASGVFVLPVCMAAAWVHFRRNGKLMLELWQYYTAPEYRRLADARDAEWRVRQAKMIAEGEARMAEEFADKILGRKTTNG